MSVSKLYIELENFRGGYVFLNRSKDVVCSKDKELVVKAIQTMKRAMQEKKAVAMIKEGTNLEAISKQTGLSTIDILNLRNKYIKHLKEPNNDDLDSVGK